MESPIHHRRPLRVGAVNYLNTKPLVYGLEQVTDRVRLMFDLPSRLADQLAEGKLDTALIPVVEFYSHPGYTLVSDACIACRGPVRSVKLYFRKPPAKVRRLALDEGSRTSAVLAQILLQELAGAAPGVVSLPIGEGLSSTDADAVLLIGDRAMYPQEESFVEIWDLGDRWCAWTGLPFVFAVWAGRPGIDTTCLGEVLTRARDRGVLRLERIAGREAPELGIDESTCLEYLRDNLHFQLGPHESAGLERFRELAQGRGFIPPAPPRSLHDCTVG